MASAFKLQERPAAPPPALERHAFTLDDVFAMQASGILPDDKFELIDGDIIPLAAQLSPHMIAKRALNRILVAAYEPAYAVHVEGTLRLTPRNGPSPDFFVHPDAMDPADVRGPDTVLVIEVADSSLDKDLGVKSALYARYGVPEYWIVDIPNRRIVVQTEPRDDRYTRGPEFGPGEPVRLPRTDVDVRLEQLVPDA